MEEVEKVEVSPPPTLFAPSLVLFTLPHSNLSSSSSSKREEEVVKIL